MLFLIDITVSIYKLILIFVEIYFLAIYYPHFYITFYFATFPQLWKNV